MIYFSLLHYIVQLFRFYTKNRFTLFKLNNQLNFCSNGQIERSPSTIYRVVMLSNIPAYMLHDVADNTDNTIFIRSAIFASQICEIPRNSERIQTYRSRSRSSKVSIIDLGINWKRMHILLPFLRYLGLPCGVNCIILTSTVLDWSIPSMWQTDKRTNGRTDVRAIAYSALSISRCRNPSYAWLANDEKLSI